MEHRDELISEINVEAYKIQARLAQVGNWLGLAMNRAMGENQESSQLRFELHGRMFVFTLEPEESEEQIVEGLLGDINIDLGG